MLIPEAEVEYGETLGSESLMLLIAVLTGPQSPEVPGTRDKSNYDFLKMRTLE